MVVFFCFVVFHSLKEQSFCFQKGLMIWVPLYLVTYLETSFKSLYFLKKLNFFKVLNIRSLRMLHLDQCMWRPLCKKKNECTVELACFYRYFFFYQPCRSWSRYHMATCQKMSLNKKIWLRRLDCRGMLLNVFLND